jgi:hypothetical protein
MRFERSPLDTEGFAPIISAERAPRSELSTTRYNSACLRNALGARSHQIAPQRGYPAEELVLLGHKYAEATLKLDILKGQDLSRVMALKEACKTNGFLPFLATLECQVFGEVDEDHSDRYDGRTGYWDYGEFNPEDERMMMSTLITKPTRFIILMISWMITTLSNISWISTAR